MSSCRKINLSTWANDLKAGRYTVGELQFSHVNWVSSVEFKAKVTVNTGDIGKFQKELEALLTKYHIHNIWERNTPESKPKPKAKTDLEKALDKHGLGKDEKKDQFSI